MSILGFLFVVLAGAGAGLAASGEIRCAMRQTERMIRLVSRLRFLVCVRCLAIPEAMERLDEDIPGFSPPTGDMTERIREDGFLSFWRFSVREAGLRPALEKILEQLGEDLSDGEDPERAFSAALTELDSYRDVCLTRTRDTGKIYPIVGLSVGCFIGILLL